MYSEYKPFISNITCKYFLPFYRSPFYLLCQLCPLMHGSLKFYVAQLPFFFCSLSYWEEIISKSNVIKLSPVFL